MPERTLFALVIGHPDQALNTALDAARKAGKLNAGSIAVGNLPTPGARDALITAERIDERLLTNLSGVSVCIPSVPSFCYGMATP